MIKKKKKGTNGRAHLEAGKATLVRPASDGQQKVTWETCGRKPGEGFGRRGQVHFGCPKNRFGKDDPSTALVHVLTAKHSSDLEQNVQRHVFTQSTDTGRRQPRGDHIEWVEPGEAGWWLSHHNSCGKPLRSSLPRKQLKQVFLTHYKPSWKNWMAPCDKPSLEASLHSRVAAQSSTGVMTYR